MSHKHKEYLIPLYISLECRLAWKVTNDDGIADMLSEHTALADTFVVEWRAEKAAEKKIAVELEKAYYLEKLKQWDEPMNTIRKYFQNRNQNRVDNNAQRVCHCEIGEGTRNRV